MDVIEEIAAERRRQVEVEGWAADHDDHEHFDGQLAIAAGCYAIFAGGRRDMTRSYEPGDSAEDLHYVPRGWPWHRKWWKPKNPRRDLIRAAALIVAEIERLDRSQFSVPP